MTGGTPRPVLVLGPPRSGTSWLASMLARAGTSSYVREPDNWVDELFAHRCFRSYGDYLTRPLEHDHQWELWDTAFGLRALSSKPQRALAMLAQRVGTRLPWEPRLATQRAPIEHPTPWWISGLHRLARPLKAPTTGTRAIVKSVHSLWVAEQIVERYNPYVVVVRRDPIEAMPSWRDLDFGDFPFFDFPDVRTRLLEPRGIDPWGPDASPMARSAWTYAVLDLMASELCDRNPTWVATTHERLVAAPIEEFGRVLDAIHSPTPSSTIQEWVEAGNRPGSAYGLTRDLARVGAGAHERLTSNQLTDADAMLASFAHLR